jgi:hypothetical protein
MSITRTHVALTREEVLSPPVDFINAPSSFAIPFPPAEPATRQSKKMDKQAAA